MNWRAFIAGAAAVWPMVVLAEQPAKVPIIGFLGPASASAMKLWAAAFVQRLSELGWNEGRNIAIEYRWADGHTELLSEIAAEFVGLRSMSL